MVRGCSSASQGWPASPRARDLGGDEEAVGFHFEDEVVGHQCRDEVEGVASREEFAAGKGDEDGAVLTELVQDALELGGIEAGLREVFEEAGPAALIASVRDFGVEQKTPTALH